MFLSVKRYLTGPYSVGDGPMIHEPVPHKWLPGDTVDPDTKSVVQRGAHRDIVGIVDFLNRTGMGFSGRGVPLYLFHPLDPKYPPMIVGSKQKYTTNKIVTATVEHWTEKWPRAGIVAVLGDVGDPAVERRALLLRASPPKPSESMKLEAKTADHDHIRWDTVFNIDPDGCEDVDDVICWRAVENGYEAAIGIANVAAWVTEGSELDIAAMAAGQTLYNDGTVVSPMLPTLLSANLASLRANTFARPVLALCFVVESGHVVFRTWRQLMVTVDRAYTYESVLADDAVCLILPRLLTALTGSAMGDDPHHWIEVAMIAYNRAAAAALRSSGVGLLRAHGGRTNEELTALAETTGCRDLAFLGASAGSYVSGDSADCAHAGLGLDVYCHASSPLRRYADLVNQRWLRHLLFGAERPSAERPSAPLVARHLNERSAVAKAYERDAWFLAHLRTDTITTVTGFVISATGDDVVIYVPDWRRKIRGVCTSGTSVGARVTVRAYTDLKRCSWSNRIVCSVT